MVKAHGNLMTAAPRDTPSFSLRPPSRTPGAEPLRTWVSTARIASALNMAPHVHTGASIQSYLLGFDGRSRIHFSVLRRNDGRQVGFCVVSIDGRHRNAVCQIALCDRRSASWASLTQVAVSLADWLFSSRDIAKLVFRIGAGRSRMANFLAGLGISAEGLLRSEIVDRNGSGRLDQLVYGVRSDEWGDLRDRLAGSARR